MVEKCFMKFLLSSNWPEFWLFIVFDLIYPVDLLTNPVQQPKQWNESIVMTGNIFIKLFPVMSQVQMMGKSCYAFHVLIGRVNL